MPFEGEPAGRQGVSVPHLPHPNFINHTATNSTRMKYTARHIQRFLETGRIDATLWKNHFPNPAEREWYNRDISIFSIC